MNMMVKIEEKLYQNRYIVDENRPHIRIKDEAHCAACTSKACTVCCPAGCYSTNEAGGVTLATDGCLECGTCRVICQDSGNIEWDYPRGGYGISYKFG
ncbi:ferredoxin family protein [Azospirillum doebereinerae]|nr:ferredoxin family protein [Azospirillum doebereinerae]MCG5239600.1 ferredoxin family protein [Azospirillum doebereinerae]